MLPILLLGEERAAEFSAVVATLAADPEVALQREATIANRSDLAPELIVVLQRHSGEHTPAQVKDWQTRFPLSRWIVVFGAWSEGETRTGKPLPGTVRVHALDWPAFWQTQRQRLAAGQLPAWQLPPTATADEQWLMPAAASGRPDAATVSTRQSMAIVAAHRETYEALADVVRVLHAEPVWVRPFDINSESVKAVIWADVDLQADLPSQVERLRQAFGTVPLIALANFPRPEDAAALHAAGVAAVLRLPLTLSALEQALSATIG